MSNYTWQQKWIAIAPKPFSLLSILGSSYIIKHTLSSNERRSQVYHHILLGFCAYDIILSFTIFWGTWAIPSDTPNVYLASGTQATCNAQAFLQQLGLAAPIYTAELAAYYFLIVVFGWKERQLKRIEILLHLIPSGLAWSSSIVGIVTNSFSDSVFWCWYSPDRSNFRFGFFYGIVWCCILLVCLLMALIYLKVLLQERKVKKYQPTTTTDTTEGRTTQQRREKKVSLSKQIAAQAVLYSGCFVLTWLFASWARIYEMVNGTDAPFVIEALFSIFAPLQGFFNMFIYFRPKYLRYRLDHPDFSVSHYICSCGGLRSRLRERVGSSLANATYRVNFNPAAANDLYESSAAEKSHKPVAIKNGAMNGSDQDNRTSTMKIVAEKDSRTGETHNPCEKRSTVRFAEASIEEEEEKIEASADEIP